VSAAFFLSSLHGFTTPVFVVVALRFGPVPLAAVVALFAKTEERRQSAIKVLEILTRRQSNSPAPTTEPQRVRRGMGRSR
jgi:hypothetical protein